MNEESDIERICRLARELNISQQEAVIKYGEYKALDEKEEKELIVKDQ